MNATVNVHPDRPLARHNGETVTATPYGKGYFAILLADGITAHVVAAADLVF